MALVLIGMALLFALLLFYLISIKPLPNGQSMIFLGHRMLGPAQLAVPAAMVAEVQITGGLWLLLAIFASAPLLVSTMEKGWVELTFTKGVSRWKVLLGAYFGGLTLYAATLAVATLPTAIWLWAKTGVGFRSLLVSILIQVFGFAALMALAALSCMPRSGAALPIMLPVLVWILCPFLASREQGFFTIITSTWARAIITWLYNILPKCTEIVGASERYIQFHSLGPWFPFWSTGIFIVATLGLTMYLLHRKSL
jgi:ABC-type transport system involved in multi-copper enzyme maturation permease subunit